MAQNINEMMRSDRRRLRAMALQHAIMQIVAKYVPEDRERDCMRDLSRELFEKLHAEGVEIITDATRAEADLPPRGPDGWTQEELLALETRRLEVMMAPMKVSMYPMPETHAAIARARDTLAGMVAEARALTLGKGK